MIPIRKTREPRRTAWYVPPLLALAGVLFAGCKPSGSENGLDHQTGASSLLQTEVNRIRAVTFDARRPPHQEDLQALHDLGVTHLALVSFGFQESAGDPHLHFLPNPRWYSESAHGARTLAKQAKALGMAIILKPQIWLRGGAWTADIGFDTERDWVLWQDRYHSYLTHTALLAEEIGAEVLVIGTELSNPVRKRPDWWRSLIRDIRSIYTGKLTYGANWYEDYLVVPFWDALDMIGVQAYFPVSKAEDPDLETIKESWQKVAEDLRALSYRESMPILFTELGYRSVSYAAAEPWRWPSRDETAPADVRLQADLFRGFFESIWDRPWFSGAIIWKVYPASNLPSENHALDFTPQGKPAEEVIRRWFTRPVGTRRSDDTSLRQAHLPIHAQSDPEPVVLRSSHDPHVSTHDS